MGEFKWRYWGIEELEDSKLWDTSLKYLREYLNENESISIKDVDAYITKYFTKKIIDNITDRTILNLDEMILKSLIKQ